MLKRKNIKKNLRLVSNLNCFSKIYEKSLQGQLRSYMDKLLSEFVSTYQKSYSTSVLIRLIENWSKALSNFGQWIRFDGLT